MAEKLKISGVGCCLVDRLYNVSFSGDEFKAYLSKQRGDGGLTPGQLIFREEFEEYGSKEFQQILDELLPSGRSEKINIGGPSLVSMIHASQISDPETTEYHFYGMMGDDEDGKFIRSLLGKTPLQTGNYRITQNDTPSTVVLSDAEYDHGHGERIFINSIAAAWDFTSGMLDEQFFASDVVVFGGTALVPQIHDHLTELLARAKASGSITVVNTVYDFRNERINPGLKWPLGKSDESYKHIDLLITDLEEALQLSGKRELEGAMQFFREQGVGAVIVTSGAENIRVWSDGSLFGHQEEREMPVSRTIVEELKKGHSGDTTGCGDNFAGGVIASLADQLKENTGKPDITEACAWGIASGGCSCFYMGGMFEESEPGQKRALIEPYYLDYIKSFNR
ncbi:MAG: carbohydrate kinase family protein [Bacteroidetes bacterium]|nr:carbohydrate kinase family protein [Bacteroidota bacterium]